MRKLIRALLELARLDAGQEQMKRLRFDFAKTIADCIELTKPLADEIGVKILSEFATARNHRRFRTARASRHESC